MAPHSKQGYGPFHLGTVVTAEGETYDVGKIVMDTRHASIHLGYAATAVHYDNTGDEIAVIRCGEDEFGIWFSGAVVPEATPKKVAKLRRSPLSGDWRREKGSLELTAALAVNAPAFPVYSMEAEDVMALTAAGSVWFDDEPEDVFVAPTGIIASISRAVEDVLSARQEEEYEDQEERDELAARLRDLEEDEEIYAQRQRTERARHMFATDTEFAPGAAPPPAAGGVPAPVAPGAPVPAAPGAPADPAAAGAESATDAAGMDIDAWNIAAMADARYSEVVDAGSATEIEPGTAAPAPATEAAPVPAAPVPPAK